MKKLYSAAMKCFKCGSLVGYMLTDQDIDFEIEMPKQGLLPVCKSCKELHLVSFDGATI